MLISFTVGNYRSFRKPTKISFCVDDDVRESPDIQFKQSGLSHSNRVLKSDIFFGANASGKSNVLSAILSLADLVIGPNSSDNQGLPTDTFANRGGDVFFEIEFSCSSNVYLYSITYNNSEVVSEKLLQDDRVVFERQHQNFVFSELPDAVSEEMVKTIRKTTLALFFAQNLNIKSAAEAYSWFYNLRHIVRKEQFIVLNQDSGVKEKIMYALRFADLNVVDIQVEESVKPVKMVNLVVDADGKPSFQQIDSNQKKVDVYLVHRDIDGGEYKISLESESDGTRNYLFLILFLLTNNDESDVTLLIDEFDSHLHESLSTRLVKLLNSSSSNIQFIASSHNKGLMDLLAKSQIYLTEKHYGETGVCRLSDFKDTKDTRSDVRYSTKYAEGRYGAVPMINEPGLMGIFDL